MLLVYGERESQRYKANVLPLVCEAKTQAQAEKEVGMGRTL